MRNLYKRGGSIFLSLALLLGTLPTYAAEVKQADSPLSLMISSPSEDETYPVGQEVIVDVIAPDGASLYYTDDGEEPNETSARVLNNAISVTASEPRTVTVKVLAVVEETVSTETPVTQQPEESPVTPGEIDSSEGQNDSPQDREDQDDTQQDGEGQDDTQQGGEGQDDTQQGGEGQDDTQQGGEYQNNVQQGDEDQGNNNEDGSQNTKNVPVTTSLMRFPSVGMSAAATLSSVALVAEGQEAEDNLVSQVDGEVNGAVTTVRKIYTESIEIKFVAAVNTISLETVTPELSVEKNVFDLNAEAEITVTNLPEGSVIYYTTDDTSPDSSGSRTKIENGEITVTSPNQEDGGAVTVQVVFAAEDDANTAYSAVSELTVSFYNTTNSNEDVISLLVNEGTFYFKEIKTAFAAADDPNLNGDVTFTLLDDAVYEGVNSRVYLFTGVPGTVTLDLNGNNLTFSGTSGKNYYAYLCATRTIITDSTASGQAVSQAENK